MERVPLCYGRLALEFADVSPCDERLFTRTGNDQNANRIIVPQFVKSCDAFAVDLVIQGVQFIGAVYGEYRDLAAFFDGDGFVRHKNKCPSPNNVRASAVLCDSLTSCGLLQRHLFADAIDDVVVSDPGDKKPQPAFLRFFDSNADPRGAVACR